jgi:uncharacterized cupredoxin-like copper-binding protein
VAGFFVVIAFGVGLTSMAAFDSTQPTAAVSSIQAAGSEIIDIKLGELYIKPAELSASPGVPLTFEVTNAGGTEHNFAIEGGPATEMIPPGETATLQVPSLEAGDYTFICEVVGHADGGMKGMLTVSGDGSPTLAASGEHAGPGMSGMSAEEMVKVDSPVTASFPAETRGLGGQPLEFEIVDGVKVFELTADQTRWEVEPGKVLDAVAYNGTLPGPQINAGSSPFSFPSMSEKCPVESVDNPLTRDRYEASVNDAVSHETAGQS